MVTFTLRVEVETDSNEIEDEAISDCAYIVEDTLNKWGYSQVKISIDK